jgi:MYXO-CTERM domain-containing protein
VKPGLDLAFAKRGEAKLPELVRADVPEIDVKAVAAGTTVTPPPTAGTTDKPATPPPAAAPPPAKKKSGCGCSTDGGEGAGLALLGGLGVAALVTRRRRRR